MSTSAAVGEGGGGGSTASGATAVVNSVVGGRARFLLALFVRLLRADVEGRRERRSFLAMEDSSGMSSSVLFSGVGNEELSFSMLSDELGGSGGGDGEEEVPDESTVVLFSCEECSEVVASVEGCCSSDRPCSVTGCWLPALLFRS